MANIPYRAGKFVRAPQGDARGAADVGVRGGGGADHHPPPLRGRRPDARGAAPSSWCASPRAGPRNLSAAEKQELRRLVGEMDLWQLSKDLAAVASPVGMPGHRKKRQR